MALAGFQHLEEIYRAKYFNKDFATATPSRGLKYLATGAGAKLSGQMSSVARDMLPYFKSNGRTAPALEFVSPIKGPNLSNITVRVGSGKMSAKAGARAYDQDVERESSRLGLPGWGKLT